MKKLFAVILLLALAAPLFAVEGRDVEYLGGTVPGIKEGAVGHLDTTQADRLVFVAGESRFEIPWAKVRSYEYTRDFANHAGLAPTVASILLIKGRQKRHYVRIDYKDANDTEQIAIFEVPKEMPRTLMPIIQMRAGEVRK